MDICNSRFEHHVLAMFVAHGLDAAQIERLAHVNRLTTTSLLGDPSFLKLVSYYRGGGQFKDREGHKAA
jgi:hypothetical protein